MVSSQMREPRRASGDTATLGRLFLLDLSDDRVVSLNPDGSDRKVIVTECRYPDGIAVDVAAGHIYWTNMGNPAADDGSIERADLDGQNRQTIVGQGGTFTPKQLQLETKSRSLGAARARGQLAAGSTLPRNALSHPTRRAQR